ncbi:MAG: hypothetical protein KY475_13070 [Planctomycetes bacterium]|nr:hypothetical protein [Planctomycetota bacterium]
MSRTAADQYDRLGFLCNGFDYENQAWVVKGHYQRCGHPEEMGCRCFGRLHEGETVHEHAQPSDEELLAVLDHSAALWCGRI